MNLKTFIKRTEGVNRDCLAYLIARNLMHGSGHERTCRVLFLDVVAVLELAGMVRNKDFVTMRKKEIKIICKTKLFKHV